MKILCYNHNSAIKNTQTVVFTHKYTTGGRLGVSYVKRNC